jgi:hypothetical protein
MLDRAKVRRAGAACAARDVYDMSCCCLTRCQGAREPAKRRLAGAARQQQQQQQQHDLNRLDSPSRAMVRTPAPSISTAGPRAGALLTAVIPGVQNCDSFRCRGYGVHGQLEMFLTQ